jgi:hypothetical protein
MFGSEVLNVGEHNSQPWLIHKVANGFRVLDVWALPTPGGPDDFPELVQLWSGFDPGRSSPVVRGLFAIRWALGRVFGLDRTETGLGARVQSLRERLPDGVGGAEDLVRDGSPFVPLYLTDNEFAMEIANRTVHGVLHVGWVRSATGRWRGQLAVLVRPNGAIGAAYLAAIAPFRHVIVYPLMMRDIGRMWREQVAAS